MLKFWFMQWLGLVGACAGFSLAAGDAQPLLGHMLIVAGFVTYTLCSLALLASADRERDDAKAEGVACGTQAEQQLAIQRKLGRYYADPADGHTFFTYECQNCMERSGHLRKGDKPC